jgi:MATE family multidrug resistance protein
MGLVDSAVLGRLGSPLALAAVAVGGSIFTVLYWCFSFLRFTTTGLVAQAAGQQSPDAVVLAGLRPMLAALLGGVGLLLLQQPLLWLALHLLAPPPDVAGSPAITMLPASGRHRLPCCLMRSLPGCWAWGGRVR